MITSKNIEAWLTLPKYDKNDYCIPLGNAFNASYKQALSIRILFFSVSHNLNQEIPC
jgi:hypothetical protein